MAVWTASGLPAAPVPGGGSRSARAARRRRRTSGRCPCRRRTSSRPTRRAGTRAPRRHRRAGCCPYLLAASQMTKRRSPTRRARRASPCCGRPAEAGGRGRAEGVGAEEAPETNATAMAAVTPKTMVSTFCGSSAWCSTMTGSRAGCRLSGRCSRASCSPGGFCRGDGAGLGQCVPTWCGRPRCGRRSLFSSVAYQRR